MILTLLAANVDMTYAPDLLRRIDYPAGMRWRPAPIPCYVAT